MPGYFFMASSTSVITLTNTSWVQASTNKSYVKITNRLYQPVFAAVAASGADLAAITTGHIVNFEEEVEFKALASGQNVFVLAPNGAAEVIVTATDSAAGGGGGGDGAVTGPLGRQGDATSVSTALSTEDVAILNGVSGKLPATLGQKTSAASMAVTIASDQTAIPAVGNVASGATDSGNPVKVAGVYNSTLPTLTTGQRGDVQAASDGSLRATMLAVTQSGTDAVANGVIQYPMTVGASTSSVRPLGVATWYYNGTTWDRARGDTNGAYTAGNVAAGVTDAGNPVKIGGVNNTTLPTLTTGQRGDAQLDTRGGIVTVLKGKDNTNFVNVSTLAADAAAALTALAINSQSLVYNGATWDRARGDTNGSYVVRIPVTTAGAAITPVVTSAVASGLVLKASAGNLYGLNVVNGTNAGYVMVFNATSVPADGAVTPLKVYQLPANGAMNLSFDPPIRFGTGISVAFSTTGAFTKTADATAFISGDIL